MKIAEDKAFERFMSDNPELTKNQLVTGFDNWITENLYECSVCGTLFTEKDDLDDSDQCSLCWGLSPDRV